MATAGADAKGGGDKKLQPIIVKRIKKGGHGAHGGAWKIAYADFVTAMMAFFLLMWLLGSTTEGDLRGIAAYFKSPLKVAMSGGRTTGDRTSIMPGGGNDLTQAHGQVKKADSERDEFLKRASEKRERRAAQDAARIQALRAKVEAAVASNATLNEYRSQVRMDITPDGLQIQIVDDENRPMFDIGSAVVKPYMRTILREVGMVLGDVENRISLAGHTDATPYGSGDRGYSNWELSADRANSSRRELAAAGMPEDKLARVVGLASTDLLLPENPRAPQNRRITITVLTHEAEERLLSRADTRRETDDATSTQAQAGVSAEEFVAEKRDNPASFAPSSAATP